MYVITSVMGTRYFKILNQSFRTKECNACICGTTFSTVICLYQLVNKLYAYFFPLSCSIQYFLFLILCMVDSDNICLDTFYQEFLHSFDHRFYLLQPFLRHLYNSFKFPQINTLIKSFEISIFAQFCVFPPFKYIYQLKVFEQILHPKTNFSLEKRVTFFLLLKVLKDNLKNSFLYYSAFRFTSKTENCVPN